LSLPSCSTALAKLSVIRRSRSALVCCSCRLAAVFACSRMPSRTGWPRMSGWREAEHRSPRRRSGRGGTGPGCPLSKIPMRASLTAAASGDGWSRRSRPRYHGDGRGSQSAPADSISQFTGASGGCGGSAYALHNANSPTRHYEGSKVMSVLPPDPPAWNVSSHSLQWLQAPRLKELVPGLMP
jgi:hypothetical protein